jgi:exodeoxyribonuclease VII large subunit
MSEAALDNVVEWSVSELSAALKRTVEEAFGYVRVRGEISGFRGASPSGHCYFRLKDDKAVLEAVIWKGTFNRMRIRPEEGLDVIACGRLTTFPGSSKYQIVVETLEMAGIGALMKLLEERKKKFAAAGLFDAARKQLLPFLPEVIGVVTSPTGAVIRDILHRLSDRFPRHVLVWPVRVQGETSAAEVANAIAGFNRLDGSGPVPRPDLIIVARGGGSLEDLWSFNEEIVVLAASESMIPLVSAVGHETDFTLLDFVADQRAPTPTAAAEFAVPVRSDLLSQISALASRKLACWRRGLDQRRKELTLLSRALPGADDVLAGPRQRLDACAERLPRALLANAQLHHTQYLRIAGRLSPQAVRALMARRRDRFEALAHRLRTGVSANAQAYRARIARERDRTATLFGRVQRCVDTQLDQRYARLERAERLLSAFSYREVLKRGYALVRDEAGTPLRSAAAITPPMRLEIELADGRVRATAGETLAVAPLAPLAPMRRRSRRSGDGNDGGQGNLFG